MLIKSRKSTRHLKKEKYSVLIIYYTARKPQNTDGKDPNALFDML